MATDQSRQTLSAGDAASPDRRSVIGGIAVVLAAGGAYGARGAEPIFTPEMFGAKGDGTADDTLAFQAMAARVNLRRGGEVELKAGARYIVGRQGYRRRQPDHYGFDPAPIFELRDCTYPIIIRGNGAEIRCFSGGLYGVFNPDGTIKPTKPGYQGPGGSTPFNSLILLTGCSGHIQVEDLTLDGMLHTHRIGGGYSDTGWQLQGSGLVLHGCTGGFAVERVRCVRNPLDGLVIQALAPMPRGASAREGRVADCVFDANGRQGVSVVGGAGYSFTGCRFTRTGRTRGSNGVLVNSAPGAGVDLEAETAPIRDVRFTSCTFSDNSGAGMVADTGDTEDASFARCTFIGTTNWSAWPNKPGFSFEACTFVGAVVRAFGSEDAARATRFLRCRFTDDPARSPTGRVFGGTNSDHPIADLSDARNVLFDDCIFSALHGFTLPWSTGAIYRNCTMVQTSTKAGFPRGRFIGTNRITGRVDLYGSKVVGTTTVNGVVRE